MILIWILIITGLAAFACILCFAATKGMPVENWLADYSYAHRGLHGQDVPENSMRAFELAAEKGYGIELDVHLSADGIPVVIHDDHLKRMTGMDKPVSALDAQSLSALSLAGSGEGIPLFEEVLRKVNGRVPLLIEIKSRGRAGELEQKTWELLRSYNGLFAVQSFSPYSIGWFYRNAPNVLRGQLSSAFRDVQEELPGYQIFGLKHLLVNFLGHPNFISYEIDDLPRGVVSRLKRGGVTVLGWTVRTEKQMERAGTYCDAVIFEDIRP